MEMPLQQSLTKKHTLNVLERHKGGGMQLTEGGHSRPGMANRARLYLPPISKINGPYQINTLIQMCKTL